MCGKKIIQKKFKKRKNIFWKDVSHVYGTKISFQKLFDKNIVPINDFLRECGSFMNLYDYNLISGIIVIFLI